ncbi:uncharacterized protein LOC135384232 [Ornithodoros turicata]|uniref:uncharacterized protein LOC135384232 n=1 Tax=Ornithodoros turicata TaxID=34597 RepID=UPI003139E9BC
MNSVPGRRHRKARRSVRHEVSSVKNANNKCMGATLLSATIVTFGFLLAAYSSALTVKSKLFPSNSTFRPVVRGYVVDTSACRIPDFSPFDPSVAKYYNRVKYYKCFHRPSFVEQERNILLLNTDVLTQYYNTSPETLTCSYRYVKRNESSKAADFTVYFSAPHILRFGRPIKFEQIKVECKLEGNSTFHDFFLIPMLKQRVERRCNKISPRKTDGVSRMNIIFLGVDSVSRLNSLRHLEITRNYLFRNFHTIELFGLTKVGPNSFPNQLAMLSGMNYDEGCRACKRDAMDNESFLWDTYSGMGYRTMFLEEAPEWGLFTFFCSGFRGAPTDYYPRLLMLGVYSTSYSDYCMHQRLRTEAYLQYTSSLLTVLADRPSFIYSWMSDLTHDFFNYAGYVDLPFRRTFETLTKTGVMDRSLVVFVSDHGLRYGDFRQTLMGRYEDRLPLCVMMFPPAFREMYPEIMENLRVNQHRLTTPFDIHATLVELAQFPGSRYQAEYRTRYGLSLLHEVPENRSCNDAFIDAYYCCCHELEDDNTTGAAHLLMAHFIVKTVNEWLMNEAPGMCKMHVLKEITDVRKISGAATRSSSYYWITIVTRPGDAVLEGAVRVFQNGTISLEKLSRLNMYRYQSSCIASSTMERYCVCR